jgi:hypothetical protein
MDKDSHYGFQIPYIDVVGDRTDTSSWRNALIYLISYDCVHEPIAPSFTPFSDQSRNVYDT